MHRKDFEKVVRKNWDNPLGLGKIVVEEARTDGRFSPADDKIERALEIGMIIQETRQEGPDAFLKKYDEMAMTALGD